MKISLILLVVLARILPAMASGPLTFRPAHWVDGEDLEPTPGDFLFFDMAFSTPTDGWIVGSRYLLHLRDGGLEMAFLREHDYSFWIQSVAFQGSGDGWAGALNAERGPWPMLHFRDGQWRGVDLPGIGWRHWYVGHIMAGQGEEAWALAAHGERPPQPGEAPKMDAAILRHDHSGWRVDTTLSVALGSARLADGCQNVDDSWWFVGSDTAAESGMRSLLARWDGAELRRVTLPAPARERSVLGHISCRPDGTIWSLGQARADPDQPPGILLLRYDGDWHRVPVPVEFHGLDASAFFVVAPEDVWVAADCVGGIECRARFLHWSDGVWQQVEIDSLPDARSTGYSISNVHFVNPQEGWAIANDYEGPGLSRGLILHYRDGKWRNRNWNWHFWHAPWLGLVGH